MKCRCAHAPVDVVARIDNAKIDTGPGQGDGGGQAYRARADDQYG